MVNKNNDKLDEIIYNSIKIENVPSKVLNDNLKNKIYQLEFIQQENKKSKYLIYFFTSLNILIFLVLLALITIFIKNIYLFSISFLICLSCIMSSIVTLIISLKLKYFSKRSDLYVFD